MSDISKSSKRHFITFGAGGKGYEQAARRLATEANRSEMFDSNNFWNESDLFQTAYLSRADVAFIGKNPRGFGYWLWKPIMLLTMLDKINQDDFLIYLDAGCELNLRKKVSRGKLLDYCEKARYAGIVAFETPFPARAWTKRDLLDHTGFDFDSSFAKQIEAGVLVLLNCQETRDFLKQWLDVMRVNDYRLLDDSPSIKQNYSDFIEHRHDQAIFTALFLNSGRVPMPPETHFGKSSKKWRKQGESYPFWASRNASRWPRHRPGIYGMLIRSLRLSKFKFLDLTRTIERWAHRSDGYP